MDFVSDEDDKPPPVDILVIDAAPVVSSLSSRRYFKQEGRIWTAPSFELSAKELANMWQKIAERQHKSKTAPFLHSGFIISEGYFFDLFGRLPGEWISSKDVQGDTHS